MDENFKVLNNFFFVVKYKMLFHIFEVYNYFGFSILLSFEFNILRLY